MSILTTSELVGLIATHAGNMILDITVRSSASSIRKNGSIDGIAVVNPHYKMLSHTFTVNVQAGFNYTRRVNKVRAAEGEAARETGPTVNGHAKLADCPKFVRQKNGNIGLAVEILNWRPFNEYRRTDNGTLVTAEELAPFKPVNPHEIDYMTPNLKSIVGVKIGGTEYTIDHADYEATCAAMADAPTLAELVG